MADEGDLFSYAAAVEAREAALERAAETTWIVRAAGMVRQIDLRDTFTSEELRLRLVEQGCPVPPHHNAWGALTMKLLRAKFIEPSGDPPRGMSTKKSHARKTPVYRRKPAGEA